MSGEDFSVIIDEEIPTIIVGDDGSLTIETPDTDIEIVSVGSVGPPGVRGATGPQGSPGPPGPAGPPEHFVYQLLVPATDWTIPHNLNRSIAAVTVYDTAGDEVMVGIREVDLNTIDLTMVIPTAGKAILE